MVNQAVMSLNEYKPSVVNPWDKRKVMHLLRRTGFGGNPELVNQFLSYGPTAAVNLVVLQAKSTASYAEPSWANTTLSPTATQAERDAYNAARAGWLNEFRVNLARQVIEKGLFGKLTMFWHDHFVTELRAYNNTPQFAYRYIQVIQDNLWNDFKTMTHTMGLTPAMLIYLNGNLNQRTSPNENYARELLELFTLGEGNGYVQNDIVQLAKALTGFTVNNNTFQVSFVATRHDSGQKTIFGKTAAYNYDTAIQLLFAEKSDLIARHICRKLYAYFVHPNPPESIVTQLAAIYKENNFRIEQVLLTLFKSEHFFDQDLIGAMISSPFELMGTMMNLVDAPRNLADIQNLINVTTQFQQNLLNPPNVAGWPGHRSWLDSNLLPTRWNATSQLVSRYASQILAFAKKLPQANDPYALAKEIAGYLIQVPVSEADQKLYGDVLLGGIPYYEWNVNSNGASSRLQALFNYLLLLPEYQLQ